LAHPGIASEAGQPIDDETHCPLLEPFIAGTQAALTEMAGAEVIVRTAVRTGLCPAPDDVSAVVQIASATWGFLVLSFPQRTAAALVKRILAGAQQEIDANLICDGVGEIANVVAGQAKALLAGTPHHFTFSLPQVVIGASPKLAAQTGHDCWVVSFSTELGEFALRLL
jgi:chemotaxis protein CheX